ncbi:MAG: hypothetical protein H6721_26440 [Sandaracinus sp.]|nr:hypothetical protein [Sandaracinus sp.]
MTRGTKLGLALVVSVALHFVVGVVVRDAMTAPSFDFDLELPDTVELGLTDEMEAAPASTTAEPPPEPAAPPAEVSEGPGAGGLDGGLVADAGVPHDAGLDDAGPPDAGRRRRRDAGVDAGPLVAEAEGPGGAGEGNARIPAGAQIALRLDLAIVRTSPLARDVAQLLAAIPDWQMVLEGSGLDPLVDLDRVMLASPNLQRAQIVMAGEHAHAAEGEDGTAWMRGVVETFGQARGVATPWREELGVQVAPWPNLDETERVVALLGPRHFAVCRPADLERVLAIAAAREAAHTEEEDPNAARARGAAALLAMEPDEALSLEVEGARNFLRRGDPTLFPARVSASMRRDGERHVRFFVKARFENVEEAERAEAYWNGQREALAGQTMVALLGFSGPLRDARVERDGSEIEVESQLTLRQVRAILGFLEGAVRRPRSASPPGATPTRSPPEPTPTQTP